MLAGGPSRWSRGRWQPSLPTLREAILTTRLPQRRRHQLSYESHARFQVRNSLLASQSRLNFPQVHFRNYRTFLSETAQTVLTPPLVFVGLLFTLWTYKCIMMVLFQDKIIYMPSMPPFSRSEKIEDYANECKPVAWESRHIKSLDGTKIALCIGHMPPARDTAGVVAPEKIKEVVICYFQGNGSSTPPRLPILSNVLKILQARNSSAGIRVHYTLIALSYRGYWTSSGRARQSGIELDAEALLHHVADTFAATATADVQVILWGQSIGSGVATTAAARYLTHQNSSQPPISGLVLETPFSGIKSMLIALYPQKWLPYRYLWPFLWNHWDSEAPLRQMSTCTLRPRVLLLPATRDEVVPAEEADKLEKLCVDMHFEYERTDVVGALHHEATSRRIGQQAIARFIADVAHK